MAPKAKGNLLWNAARPPLKKLVPTMILDQAEKPQDALVPEFMPVPVPESLPGSLPESLHAPLPLTAPEPVYEFIKDLAAQRPVFDFGPNGPAPGTAAYSLLYIEMIWKLEMDAALARLHRRLEAERRKMQREYLLRFWPFVLGLAISGIAPQLKEMLNLLFHPGGMGLVFPLVVIAGRPELHLGSHLAGLVPQIMLYVEYPLEGLLIKSVIKGKVTAGAVFKRYAALHILAGILLLLVSGVIR
jgi:hypothetical protein